jgi:hypothetical protein
VPPAMEGWTNLSVSLLRASSHGVPSSATAREREAWRGQDQYTAISQFPSTTVPVCWYVIEYFGRNYSNNSPKTVVVACAFVFSISVQAVSRLLIS